MADKPDSHPSPSQPTEKPQPQVPNISGFRSSPSLNLPVLPIMHPSLIPGLVPICTREEHNHGPGIYAVPFHPLMGPTAQFPSDVLIPLAYKIPVRTRSGGEVGENVQQHGPQGRVIARRFQFAFQLDWLLMLKLAAVVYLFGQEGSRRRQISLVLLAFLVYLYQTGILAPLIRRILQRQGPPRPAVLAENGLPVGRVAGIGPQPGGNTGAENQNQAVEPEEPVVANENNQEVGRRNRINWLAIVKEIQMIVLGFATSLFHGFQHND